MCQCERRYSVIRLSDSVIDVEKMSATVTYVTVSKWELCLVIDIKLSHVKLRDLKMTDVNMWNMSMWNMSWHMWQGQHDKFVNVADKKLRDVKWNEICQ